MSIQAGCNLVLLEDASRTQQEFRQLIGGDCQVFDKWQRALVTANPGQHGDDLRG